MKTYVIGDIHGGHKAMLQCFERSGFDYENDHLISLGDIADGWPEVTECFEELFKIKNLTFIIGNHDWWLLNWLRTGSVPYLWTSQGGYATIRSFNQLIDEDSNDPDAITYTNDFRIKMIHFLQDAPYYIVDDKNRLFVHGGYDLALPIDGQQPRFSRGKDSIYFWDRDMWYHAGYMHRTNLNRLKTSASTKIDKIGTFDEIFIGHTTTSRIYPNLKPVNFVNVWNLDQGGGWEGKLTIMDVDTHEYWQSDIVAGLYPKIRGRN